jgi:hypothetical protein
MESTMPWTETTRPHYRRDELRYASDLKDGEWAVIAPFMPEPSHLGARANPAPAKAQRKNPIPGFDNRFSTGEGAFWK